MYKFPREGRNLTLVVLQGAIGEDAEHFHGRRVLCFLELQQQSHETTDHATDRSIRKTNSHDLDYQHDEREKKQA
jgi:hypothetical protein